MFTGYYKESCIKSFLWDSIDGLCELNYDHENIVNVNAIAILDDGTIIFRLNNKIILKNNNDIDILEIKDNLNSTNIINDRFMNLSVRFGYHDVFLINNRKQFLITCRYFDEAHPFLLNPK